jgi:hypothetical protein
LKKCGKGTPDGACCLYERYRVTKLQADQTTHSTLRANVRITSYASATRALFSGPGTVIAPKPSFIDRRSNARAFDFEQCTWLPLPEQSLSMRFLKTDLHFVQFIVRGCAHGPYPYQRWQRLSAAPLKRIQNTRCNCGPITFPLRLCPWCLILSK